MTEDSFIRWYPGQDAPVRLQMYAYVPWEVHGMRGCLLPEKTKLPSGKSLPWAPTYVLDCGRCPVAEVTRGKHAFQLRTVAYVTSLARVWALEEWPAS